jgi:HEPN domain-containing protein
MTRGNPQPKVEPTKWHERAFNFYLAARLLAANGLLGPAAFSARQAVELLLKAALVYWDTSFDPIGAGHAVQKMVRSVRNKVPNGRTVEVPDYLWADKRYLSVTRYPTHGKGVGIPNSLVDDLDALFRDLTLLLPLPRNCGLATALIGKHPGNLRMLTDGGHDVGRLRLHFGLPEVAGSASMPEDDFLMRRLRASEPPTKG